jgi:uncharacterized protein YggE
MRWAYSTLALGASPGCLFDFLQRRRDNGGPKGVRSRKALPLILTEAHLHGPDRTGQKASVDHTILPLQGFLHFPQIHPNPAVLDMTFHPEETMKFLKIAVAFCLLAGLATAQDRLPPKVVRVVGTAEVKVVPDRAVIEIGVEKQDPNASVAKHAEDAAARRILSALRGNRIDDKDIQTTFLSLQPQSYTRKGVRISYFVAAQTMTITVRDLAKLDTLLESLIKAGGNRIDSIGYETSDLRKYRDQARDEAVKAAREKAGALAKALGQDIGKAQTIEEVPESGYQFPLQIQNALFANVRSENVSMSLERSSIAVGQKSISALVTVSFELN